MATYRVGDAGAEVYDKDGRFVTHLQPGTVVVEGLFDANDPAGKRLKAYEDKMIRPAEDKSL